MVSSQHLVVFFYAAAVVLVIVSKMGSFECCVSISMDQKFEGSEGRVITKRGGGGGGGGQGG